MPSKDSTNPVLHLASSPGSGFFFLESISYPYLKIGSRRGPERWGSTPPDGMAIPKVRFVHKLRAPPTRPLIQRQLDMKSAFMDRGGPSQTIRSSLNEKDGGSTLPDCIVAFRMLSCFFFPFALSGSGSLTPGARIIYLYPAANEPHM
ncbi:hypothetical protein DFH09DRAFT_1146490, partial [Mycena vulgaris]